MTIYLEVEDFLKAGFLSVFLTWFLLQFKTTLGQYPMAEILKV